MKDVSLGVIESRFADIIWKNEPLSSAELSVQAELTLGWKKTTSYTVLKRLCDKGIFKNEKGTVTSLISKEEFFSLQSERFVEETFDGSLPAFFAAFTKRKSISQKDLEEIRRMIDSFEEG